MWCVVHCGLCILVMKQLYDVGMMCAVCDLLEVGVVCGGVGCGTVPCVMFVLCV